MKRIIIFILAIFSISFSIAQNQNISKDLLLEINNSNEDKVIKINIIMRNQLDIDSLKFEFINNQIPLQQRQSIIIRELMNIAQNSQVSLMQQIEKERNNIQLLRRYWIVNMMTVNIKVKSIESLMNRNDIGFLQLDKDFIAGMIKPVKTQPSSAKAIGGSEPGLRAINAHKLWAMGYTGRGRLCYTMDTGIWPDHDVFSGRFMGNYFPISRAWYGFDSEFPRDKSGSHGTHVTGTILGLDKNNNDTIGLAMNAYFMVSDPIVTSLADIKPYSDFALAYQWALNPDGDTNTTNDIPDVINNSWGRGPATDTNLCHSSVSQMLQVIEAAGIANVYSAGNEGPSDSSISVPHHINVGLLNTFTVGSIIPHDSSYPISTFSSRGPTICPGTGSYAIKPEVVAPGQQIRSSVANNSYATYNGTSMASPHVSGSVLLLKEAFPYLSGEDILFALYTTAQDLGIPGEDNTYGKGIIDVYAAYNYLAQNNTPVPPNSSPYDVKIKEVITNTGIYTCDTLISVQLVIENIGDSSLQNFDIFYQVNDNLINTYNWNHTLNSGEEDTIAISLINSNGTGNKELFFRIKNTQNKTELDTINNRAVFRFNVRPKASLPLVEDFESATLKEKGFFVNNEDGLNTWDTISCVNKQFGTKAAIMDGFNYLPKIGQKDDLISSRIDVSGTNQLKLQFDYAYSVRAFIFKDSLKVYLIDSCDNENRTLVWAKGGDSLATFDSTAHQFIPHAQDHWKTATMDLSQFNFSDEIMISFSTVNDAGNGIYIDNVKVYDGNTPPVSISENEKTEVKLYPNPAEKVLNIEIEKADFSILKYEVYDISGKQLLNGELNNSKQKISISNLSKGIYLFYIKTGSGDLVRKFVKK